MKDKKICDICIFCGHEPVPLCYIDHPEDVHEVKLSNILTEEEML